MELELELELEWTRSEDCRSGIVVFIDIGLFEKSNNVLGCCKEIPGPWAGPRQAAGLLRSIAAQQLDPSRRRAIEHGSMNAANK